MQDSFSKFPIIGKYSKIRKDEQGLIHKRYNQSNKIQEKEVKVVECILDEWKKSNMQHPNIVNYRQVTQIEGGYEIIMEACDGSLLDLLNQYNRENQVFKIPMLIDFLQQIMRGYQYLQSLFPLFIHRDFTLDNFLYTKSEGKYTIKLSDFGVSKIIKKEKDQKQSHLKTKTIILSESFRNQQKITLFVFRKKIYMPKEIIERTEYDNKVDVYSLGTCLYFLYQGKINEKYEGYQPGLNDPIFRDSEIKNKFIKLVREMCHVEASSRPKWDELYQYLYEIPQLYDPLNKKLYLDDLPFLEYFDTAIFQICPQNNNDNIQIQKKFYQMKNQITKIDIDQKVLSLVNKFMPLFFDQQLDRKKFFIILLVFLDKINRAQLKIIDYRVHYKQVFRLQSLQHIRNIIMRTQTKMMQYVLQKTHGDCLLKCYEDLIQDYRAQRKIIKTIKTNDSNIKYFQKYTGEINKKIGGKLQFLLKFFK